MAEQDELKTGTEVEQTDDEAKAAEAKATLEEVEKAKIALKALEEEKVKIREEIKAAREERRAVREEKTEKSGVEPEEDDVDLKTVEGWTKFIDKKAEEKTSVVSKDIDALKKTQKSKALKEFVHRHPEYASDATLRDSLLEVYGRVKSRTDLDADDILEDLEDAWAVKHRDEITKLALEAKRSKREAEMLEADVVTSGGSTGVRKETAAEDEATAEDYRIARSLGKSIKEYLPLKKQYESMQM